MSNQKEESLLIQTGEFLIGISSRKHKVVKFIDSERGISTLKIITIPSKSQVGILFKRQIQHIKQYLVRRHQVTSQLSITPFLEMEQIHSNNTVIKVITKFSEYPTLNDFYRQQHIQATTRLGFKLYNHHNKLALVYFFEELFQLIVRAGGITHYFYTPNNFFYMPPSPDSGLELGKLSLNLTSTAGVKFIHKHQIPKDQFIEIYPCLPPNAYSLINENEYDKLDVLIKIRSFVFNMLAYLIKRVPIFFQEALDPMVSIKDLEIIKLINKSPNTFRLLLTLEGDRIKQAQQSSKIPLLDLFTKVLVQNKIQSWGEVHEMVFLNNCFNENDFSRVRRTSINSTDKAFKAQHVFSQRMLQQIWQAEENKQFYNRRGIGQKDLNVYLLVKLNCSFHRPLRWINILQYCDYQHFGEESAEIATKLMQIFTSHYFQKLRQSLITLSPIHFSPQRGELPPKELRPETEEQNGTPSGEAEAYDPFAVRGYMESEKQGMLRSGPSVFLRNVYTLPSLQRIGNKEHVVTSINHKLQTVSKFQNQMWIV